jgi:imidazolonepropionase-like amidohydrolase
MGATFQPASASKRTGIPLRCATHGMAMNRIAAKSLLLCLVTLLSTPSWGGRLVIENVHVLPMDREELLRDQALLVEDGRIVALLPMAGYVAPDEARRIDGAGGFLMPGLVDTHVHIEEYMDARAEFGDAPVFLRHGITAVFNLRGFPEHLQLRDRIAAGELLAPTLYTSGEFVNEPRVTTPAEAAAEVRAQAAAGYDLLKFREVVDHDVGVLTTHGVDRQTLRAVFDTAREIGLPVVAHAPHGLGLQGVLDNGMTLGHVGELVQLHFFPRQPPPGFTLYIAALGLLLVLLIIGCVGWGVAGRAHAGAARRLAGAAGGALVLGAGSLALVLLLLPAGLYYGNMLLIVLAGVGFAGLLLLGLRVLDGARRARQVQAGLRAGLAAAGISALIAGSAGFAQGLPLALRGTATEMDRVASRLAESGASMGTTLIIYDAVWSALAGTPGRINVAHVEPLHPEFHRRYLRARDFFAGMGWWDMPWQEKLIPRYDVFTRDLTAALHRAGVPLLAGTDAYGFVLVPPGQSMLAELEILVETGISPFEVLRSATVEPARFLGREQEFGLVAAGHRADLLLLDVNPLDDIGTLREPRAVMLRGQWLERAALDAMVDALRPQREE